MPALGLSRQRAGVAAETPREEGPPGSQLPSALGYRAGPGQTSGREEPGKEVIVLLPPSLLCEPPFVKSGQETEAGEPLVASLPINLLGRGGSDGEWMELGG